MLWTSAPRETIFLTAALLLQGVIPAVAIWINKQVVDTVVATLNSGREFHIETLATLFTGWVSAIFIETLLPPWVEAAYRNLGEKLSAHINLQLMRKVDSFVDLIHFEDSRFYDELQIIQEQTERQSFNLIGGIAQAFPVFLTLITMLILLSGVSWWIPLLILITSLPQTYVSFKIQWDIWETMYEKSPQDRRMQYYSSMILTDTYAKEVRLFGLGSLFIQRYLEAFQDKYKAMQNLRGKQAFSLTGLSVLSASGNAFAFFWIVLQAMSGKVTPGSVLLFIQSLAYTQQNLSQLMGSFYLLQENLLYMERFFNFLETKSTMSVCIPSSPVPKPIKSGITFENVDFSYPDNRVAVTGISFTIKPGETVALVGENGAGKTTLVKLLARFYDPTSGNIFIDGENLKNLDLQAWRQQIAVVFQDFCRYSLTIGENIALGNLSAINNLEQLKKAAEKSGIAQKVELFPDKYLTQLGKQFDGTELSGGEWQKLALARAFIREEDAQILILDEPTAALDPRSEYEIYRSFSKLVRGKTAILVTHRLASVRMADRILVLKAGKLIEVGTHYELLHQGGEYAALWSMQAQQYQDTTMQS
nr:ABC transporter ATP-binding protein [Brasilonema sp. UFV-L1]